MKFNMTSSTEDSLYHDALSFASISETSQFPVVDFTRSANVWYRKASIWINQAVGTWPWDDSNWATLMETSSDLVAGTTEYIVPTGVRKVDRLEVIDVNGDYKRLNPLDKSQVNVSMEEFLETDGLPTWYDLEGNYAKLYPAPGAAYVTTTRGLKWYVIRDISPFTITDTNTSPGFDNHFHRIISIGSAYDWCISNEGYEDRYKHNQLKTEISELHSEINEHYGQRHRELKPRFIPKDNDCI